MISAAAPALDRDLRGLTLIEQCSELMYGILKRMSSGVGLLEQGIDALAAMDVDALTDAELHELAVMSLRLRDRLAAVTAPVVARWDARTVWADNGARTAGTRLAVESGSSKGGADAVVRRARALSGMPVTLAAAKSGELSIDVVDVLIAANTPERRAVFAELEAELVDAVRGLRYRPAVRAVRYWCARADALLGVDGDAAEHDRDGARLYASETFDGNVEVSGRLDPVGGAIVTGELDRIIEQLRSKDAEAGVDRTLAQLRAAALVEMARRSAAMPGDARFSRPLFTAVIGDDRFRDLCELANGTVITPAHLVPYLTDAMYEAVLFDGPYTAVSVSNKRLFTGALRRAIEIRDGFCQHPSGCDEPADRCDVDHIVPAGQGGPTSQFNGRLECKVHNRNPAKHDHGAEPRPERPIDRIDVLRARIRWRMRRDHPDELLDPTIWPDLDDRDVFADTA